MTEVPSNNDPEQSPKKLDPHRRLEVVLSKHSPIEAENSEQWNQIDIWRQQHSQFIHELTWVGISQGGPFGEDISVARPRDREELHKELSQLLASNRFNPSHGKELHYDRARIEQGCNIRIGEAFWSMRDPFIKYWEGHYRPDAARMALLKRIIKEEKGEGEEDPIEGRYWQWIEAYFQGCCPQDVEVPENQDPHTVLAILERDFKIVRQLPLSKRDQEEVIRHVKLSFLSGKYPIFTSKTSSLSEQALLRLLKQKATAPDKGSLDLRAVSISSVLDRYRSAVAQDLDFEEQEKIRDTSLENDARVRLQDLERRQREYDIELDFLRSLAIPEEYATEFQDTLLRTANTTAFRPNLAHREQLQRYVQWYLEQSWITKEASDAPWSTLSHVLQNYWYGRYYFDRVRWNVLQHESNKISSASEDDQYEMYFLHRKFLEGCRLESAEINANLDADLLQLAYDNDMQIIRGLGLPEETTRAIEAAYNDWLLQGKLPLALDREMPKDREVLATNILNHTIEYQKLGVDPSPIVILELFCHHWYSLSRRPVPPKE